jgi:F0F1-type ATP synthase delta subunit
VHKHLLGGVRVQIDDHLIDVSVKGRLTNLVNALTAP